MYVRRPVTYVLNTRESKGRFMSVQDKWWWGWGGGGGYLQDEVEKEDSRYSGNWPLYLV